MKFTQKEKGIVYWSAKKMENSFPLSHSSMCKCFCFIF